MGDCKVCNLPPFVSERECSVVFERNGLDLVAFHVSGEAGINVFGRVASGTPSVKKLRRDFDALVQSLARLYKIDNSRLSNKLAVKRLNWEPRPQQTKRQNSKVVVLSVVPLTDDTLPFPEEDLPVLQQVVKDRTLAISGVEVLSVELLPDGKRKKRKQQKQGVQHTLTPIAHNTRTCAIVMRAKEDADTVIGERQAFDAFVGTERPLNNYSLFARQKQEKESFHRNAQGRDADADEASASSDERRPQDSGLSGLSGLSGTPVSLTSEDTPTSNPLGAAHQVPFLAQAQMLGANGVQQNAVQLIAPGQAMPVMGGMSMVPVNTIPMMQVPMAVTMDQMVCGQQGYSMPMLGGQQGYSIVMVPRMGGQALLPGGAAAVPHAEASALSQKWLSGTVGGAYGASPHC
eukprot:TRINITY_DN36210_c0_g1_i1.p2 TRINITY_DN36210_c0_g1~~TRINITY_DN36210_c0_g1_i1.p2  ORF type:complete len:404 (+),score=121.87 TRINITY_DN36210_c0_g1_i1:320-1531(+)